MIKNGYRDFLYRQIKPKDLNEDFSIVNTLSKEVSLIGVFLKANYYCIINANNGNVVYEYNDDSLGFEDLEGFYLSLEVNLRKKIVIADDFLLKGLLTYNIKPYEIKYSTELTFIVNGENKQIIREVVPLYFNLELGDSYTAAFYSIIGSTEPHSLNFKYSVVTDENFKLNYPEREQILQKVISKLDNELKKGSILTKRELQIIEGLSQGLTSEGISKELCISKSTVDKHRQNILKKLKVTNTPEILAVYRLFV